MHKPTITINNRKFFFTTITDGRMYAIEVCNYRGDHILNTPYFDSSSRAWSTAVNMVARMSRKVDGIAVGTR